MKANLQKDATAVKIWDRTTWRL